VLLKGKRCLNLNLLSCNLFFVREREREKDSTENGLLLDYTKSPLSKIHCRFESASALA
jgi:hypothetical protein